MLEMMLILQQKAKLEAKKLQQEMAVILSEAGL